MAKTIDAPPTQDYPPEITGYADPWIASPGEMISIKVSCPVIKAPIHNIYSSIHIILPIYGNVYKASIHVSRFS